MCILYFTLNITLKANFDAIKFKRSVIYFKYKQFSETCTYFLYSWYSLYCVVTNLLSRVSYMYLFQTRMSLKWHYKPFSYHNPRIYKVKKISFCYITLEFVNYGDKENKNILCIMRTLNMWMLCHIFAPIFTILY